MSISHVENFLTHEIQILSFGALPLGSGGNCNSLRDFRITTAVKYFTRAEPRYHEAWPPPKPSSRGTFLF